MGKLDKIFQRRARDTSQAAYDARLAKRGYTHDNAQIVSDVPVAPPIGYKKMPSMVDIVREQVRNHHLQMELDAKGYETFEEADDFDVGDPDELPKSIYEMEPEFDPPLRKPRVALDVPAASAARDEKGSETDKDTHVAPKAPDPEPKPKAK